jgi:UDP-2-acetamido-2,6-beta-L-arabino-hexul-4-ose reductase
MKILVTGSKGFIGKNLIERLKNRENDIIYEYDTHSTLHDLEIYTKSCDFVFHLAGVNRPKDKKEFLEGNFGFTSILLNSLKHNRNNCPILITSSTQALYSNPYGESKKAGEDLMFEYSIETGAKVLVYRLTNVFGKWCKPNYNSVIATFSHNIANDLPIVVNNSQEVINLIYIDDVVNEFINSLNGAENKMGVFCSVEPVYKVKLGAITDLLFSFKMSREILSIPNTEDSFIKKLYTTYLTYLPTNNFSYDLKMNTDNRGSFTEFIKTQDRGQISVNVSKPGIVKGNHWHHTKNEKFLVVSGQGVIKLRKIDESEIIHYYVSSNKLQVVDIPPGYTHNVENLGNTDMVTIIWVNENFDPIKPDTIYLEV